MLKEAVSEKIQQDKRLKKLANEEYRLRREVDRMHTTSNFLEQICARRAYDT